jgi:hypothetical protein
MKARVGPMKNPFISDVIRREIPVDMSWLSRSDLVIAEKGY